MKPHTYNFVYLASPYTHPDFDTRRRRYHETMRCAVWLHSRSIWVFSSILHWREAEFNHSLPGTWDHWWPYNQTMLFNASKLLVLALDGWQESRGVGEEIAYANTLNKPINFIRPQAYEISDE